jgi:acyl-CoA thioesterase
VATPSQPDEAVAGDFAAATMVRPLTTDEWEGTIHEGWDIAGRANGGYLLSIATRALVGATRRPDPVSVTGHYLAPGTPGPVGISTQVLKEGRRFATGFGMLSAAAQPVLAVLGTLGDVSGAEGPELMGGAPPDLPPPEECVPVIPAEAFPPPFMGKVELRLHPEDAAFGTPNQSGKPLMRGWFRLPGGEPIDTVALLCAVDAFPPTAFNASLPLAWTPTIELTAHVRARPAAGWLRCRFSTRYVSGGFLEEDGEIWDSAGRLVAQSRQLALVPRG